MFKNQLVKMKVITTICPLNWDMFTALLYWSTSSKSGAGHALHNSSLTSSQSSPQNLLGSRSSSKDSKQPGVKKKTHIQLQLSDYEAFWYYTIDIILIIYDKCLSISAESASADNFPLWL